MTRTRTLLVVAALCSALVGCTPNTTPDPNPGGCSTTGTTVTCLNIWYSNGAVTNSQIVRPVGNDLKPVIIFVHGGGWDSGYFNASDLANGPLVEGAWEATHVRREVDRGYAVMAINYRLVADLNDLSTKAPGAVLDVKAAVKWVKTNGPAYGLDPSRIALWGHSAGGHLVTLAASSVNLDPSWEPPGSASSEVDTVLSFAGVYDFNAPVSDSVDTRNQASKYLRCTIPNATIWLPPCTDLPATWASPINHVSSPGYKIDHLMLVTSQGYLPSSGDGVIRREQSDNYSTALTLASRPYSSCDNAIAGGSVGHFSFGNCETAVDAFLDANFPA